MGRGLQAYEQSHDLHALQVATASCQVRLEEQGGEDYAGENPRPRCRCLRGWVDDATLDLAGGPSAAIPTATVRRVVAVQGPGIRCALAAETSDSADEDKRTIRRTRVIQPSYQLALKAGQGWIAAFQHR